MAAVSTQIVTMKDYVIHNEYDFPAHDIAIITTNTPITFSETVGPVCLPNNQNEGNFSSCLSHWKIGTVFEI